MSQERILLEVFLLKKLCSIEGYLKKWLCIKEGRLQRIGGRQGGKLTGLAAIREF